MNELNTSIPAASTFLSDIDTTLRKAKSNLLAAQQRQKAYADQSRAEIIFSPGEQVIFSTKNLKFKHPTNAKLARKLLPRFIGPFSVVQMVGKAAVRLQLPPNYRIHPTFHVSLIHKFHADPVRLFPPPVSMLDLSPYRSIEKILAHEIRSVGGKKSRWFLVHWSGCTHLHDSWEPESNFEDSLAIDDYFRRLNA